MILFDFQCENHDCCLKHRPEEHYVDSDSATPNCLACSMPMNKVPSYAMGKVINGTPIFHKR